MGYQEGYCSLLVLCCWMFVSCLLLALCRAVGIVLCLQLISCRTVDIILYLRLAPWRTVGIVLCHELAPWRTAALYLTESKPSAGVLALVYASNWYCVGLLGFCFCICYAEKSPTVNGAAVTVSVFYFLNSQGLWSNRLTHKLSLMGLLTLNCGNIILTVSTLRLWVCFLFKLISTVAFMIVHLWVKWIPSCSSDLANHGAYVS